MPEQLQAILNRIIEWWKKFTSRQKILIISAVAVVVVAVSILAFVMTRPTTITLVKASDAKQASTIKDLLEGEKISYTTSNDGYTFYINKNDEAAANILLGSNDIPSSGYSISDALDGSFSTTEADKQKKYQVYLEDKFASSLESMANVKSAEVTLSIPNDDGTIIASNQDSYANVILDLSGKMSSSKAAGIAKYIATGLGNDNTDNITIMDSNGNVLFSGSDEVSSAGQASSNQEVKADAEENVASKVRQTLASANDSSIYDNVDIGVNLSMSFDDKNTVDYNYYVNDGQTQGYYDSRSEKTTQSTEGTGGTPGTDSNNDTTYVTEDNNNSSSSSDDVTEKYLPSEKITTTDGEVGAVSYKDSSITIVATNYVVYNEDTLRAQGKLSGTTFEKYVAKHNTRKQAKVAKAVYTAVANATGIPKANISIIAYNVPMFQYSKNTRTLTDYLQIAIAVLVFALLGFVVFRTLRKNEEEAVEEEVSVDDLLEKQDAEENLENIGVHEKSEARVLIEKFVDENPEAVAALLRNWLNDDWG